LRAHLQTAHGGLLVSTHQPPAVGAYLALFEIDDYFDFPRMEAIAQERTALNFAHQALESDDQLRGIGHACHLAPLIGWLGASLQAGRPAALPFRILYNPEGPEG